MTRTWFYQTMASDSALMAALPGGIHQSTKLMRQPEEKPFALYRSTAMVSDLRGDDQAVSLQEGYMVFVHDVEGDYLRIDSVIDMIFNRLRTVNLARHTEVISVTWLETSEDFRDEDMGTIFRYSRFQVNRKAA